MSKPFMYIIRHGHRSDHGTIKDRASFLLSFDPPLTQIGMQQSFFLGENLDQEVTGKQLLVFSSPLQRCLQTAESLLNGLQHSHHKFVDKTIYVEDALRESQEPHLFEKGDFERCHFFEGKPLIHFQTKYNSHPLFKDFRHENDPFPETFDDLAARAKKILARMEEFLKQPENADVVPILITHGWMIEEMYEIYEKKTVNKYIYASTTKLGINDKGELAPIYLDKKKY